MEFSLNSRETVGSPPRSYGLPMTERVGVPHDDARDVTMELIHDVVVEFYQRARLDDRLGPVFDRYVHDWDVHLGRMTDFWAAALLRSGRYSGRPVERHRAIEELSGAHFRRWVELFEATARDLCSPRQADAFIVRAQRMREGMTKVLRLND
jgi:hemoglobin